MTVTDPGIQLPTIHAADMPRWTRAKLITIGAVSTIAVVAMAGAVQWSRAENDATVETPTVQAPTEVKLEDLVARGFVPPQALEQAPMTERAQLEVFVDRGFVPPEALEPVSMTEQEIVEDLVNRGLIPEQTLEPAP